jgi:hypothetical protein
MLLVSFHVFNFHTEGATNILCLVKATGFLQTADFSTFIFRGSGKWQEPLLLPLQDIRVRPQVLS